MRTILSLMAMLLCMSAFKSEDPQEKVVILISSHSTPDYIGEMRENLKLHGLVLNVEKELWAKYDQLQEFAFTLTDTKTRIPMSFHFKYNDLNKHQVLMVYPKVDGAYATVLSDVSYLKSELLPLLVNKDVKKKKPILHRSYGKSGAPYRESIVLTDLKKLEGEMTETIELYRNIKADQAVKRSVSGYTYTYNGELLEDPAGINLTDMTSDVLIEELSDDSKIINIWSDEPLDRYISTSTTSADQD